MLFSANNLGLAVLAFSSALAAPTTAFEKRGASALASNGKPDANGRCGFHVTQWQTWKLSGAALTQVYDDFVDVILKDGTGVVLYQTPGGNKQPFHASDSDPAVFKDVYNGDLIMRAESREGKGTYIAFQYGSLNWASNTPVAGPKGADCSAGGWSSKTKSGGFVHRDLDCTFYCGA